MFAKIKELEKIGMSEEEKEGKENKLNSLLDECL